MKDFEDFISHVLHQKFVKANKILTKLLKKDVGSNKCHLFRYSQWCDLVQRCIAGSPRGRENATTSSQSALSCLRHLLTLRFPNESPVGRERFNFIQHAAAIDSLEAVRAVLTDAKGNFPLALLDDLKVKALHVAAYNGFMDMIRWLVEKENADVVATTSTGQNALDFAVQQKHQSVIRYLLPRVIDRQVQPLQAPSTAPQLRRARSVSLALTRNSQIEPTAPMAPVQSSDPLKRRSLKLNRHSIYGELPVVSEVLMRNTLPISRRPPTIPTNGQATLKTRPPRSDGVRNSLPPICPNRRTLSLRHGHQTLPMTYHLQSPVYRIPPCPISESSTPSQQFTPHQQQQQAMFSCLGKATPGSEGGHNGAQRRHTLAGPMSAIGRPLNCFQPPYPHISGPQTCQKNASNWSAQGPHPEVLKARAVAAFHDTTCGLQTICFNEGDIIGVFADSMITKEANGVVPWWRGFRFANGPTGGIGMFPSSHVTLLQTPGVESKKKKSDFCGQTDVLSISSSSGEDVDGDEDDEADSDEADVVKTSPMNRNGEAMHETDPNVMMEIEALVSTGLAVPLRSPPATMTSTALTGGHVTNLLIDSSNRNSATSLDSGRGSAYATSSEGSKKISTSISSNFPPQSIDSRVIPLQAQPSTMLQRLASVGTSTTTSGVVSSTSTASHYRNHHHHHQSETPRRLGAAVYRSASVQPSGASSASSGASSVGSSTSCDRSPVELLVNWLLSAGFSDYTSCIVAAGYDLSTLTRATPEDLNACGVTNPRDRQQLRARLSRLQLPDSLPDHVPASVFEWLSILNLTSYWPILQTQGLTTVEKIAVLTWEDLEEIGITKLGHQKKFILAIERLRRALSKRNDDQSLGGTDSSSRASRQVLTHTSPNHLATQPIPIAEEHESPNITDLTPPPPPAFQDPLPRQAPLDQSNHSHQETLHQHRYFSSSYLSELGTSTKSMGFEPGTDGSTKSDPLPRISEGEMKVKAGEEQGEQRGIKDEQQSQSIMGSGGENFLAVRQRQRNAVAAAAAVSIPVSVANQMIPPPTGGKAMDKDLQDMQDIRSMLDKLSEHLVPHGSSPTS